MPQPNDREDPRDANPMYKRLPAEVVSRRKAPLVKHLEPSKAAAASVELEQVLQRKPDGRAKWLAKALQQAQEGRLHVQSLYDIIASPRFVEDLTDKVGRKMYRAMHAHLDVFSGKQQKFLAKDSPLAKLYAATAWAGGQKDGDGEQEKADSAANKMEEMMARCRAFVREKQTERGERDGDAPGSAEAGGNGAAAAAHDAPRHVERPPPLLVGEAALEALAAPHRAHAPAAQVQPQSQVAPAATLGEAARAESAPAEPAAAGLSAPRRGASTAGAGAPPAGGRASRSRSDRRREKAENPKKDAARNGKKGKEKEAVKDRGGKHAKGKERGRGGRKGRSASSGSSASPGRSSSGSAQRRKNRAHGDKKAAAAAKKRGGRHRGSSSESSRGGNAKSRQKGKRKARESSSSPSERHDKKRRR